MTKVGAFLAGFALAAAAAGGAWALVLRPRWIGFEARTAAAERASQRAAREAGEFRVSAAREIARKRELEDEVERLRRAATAVPPPPMHPPAPPDPTPPEKWDRQRINQEIETLAEAPARVVTNPRYPLVVRALRTLGETGFELLCAVLAQEDFGPGMRSVCGILLGGLEDARAEKPLIAALATAKDRGLRVALLRGLAALTGADGAPTLLAVWNDPAAEPFEHRLAVRGLARRKHAVAVAVVEGGAPGSTAPLRAEAMEMLHWVAWKDGWKDVSLVPVFGKALRTADGDGQRRLALLAIEGFWSKDSAADLETFAAGAVSTELASRARGDAEAIRAGRPRPENAGAPPSATAPPPTHAAPAVLSGPAEPLEPDEPK